MIPNPILKVLSSMREHHVQCLLMGGQACVFYGAAEFSRDTDLAILADDQNLLRLKAALDALQAELIAVPNFDPAHLHTGHSIHFRCHHPEALRMRVDVMSKMRGVDPFPNLWERRTTLQTPDGTICDLLSLPDLVLAKKTQRDKDWPMIRRLVEAHYFKPWLPQTPIKSTFGFRNCAPPACWWIVPEPGRKRRTEFRKPARSSLWRFPLMSQPSQSPSTKRSNRNASRTRTIGFP